MSSAPVIICFDGSDDAAVAIERAAEVLASALGHTGAANFVLADGSVRFLS